MLEVSGSEIKWAVEGLYHADAHAVAEEINQTNGRPADILEYAKTHTDSELHKCFERSDTEAARKYRLIQARQITINLKYVPVDKSKQEVRVFYLDTKTHVYEPVTKFIVNSDKYARLLENPDKSAIYVINEKVFCKV